MRFLAAASPSSVQSRRAFTLIELLVVIIIIAILVGFLFPAFRGVQDQAKRTQAKNDLSQIVTAVNAYYTEYGKYPTTSTIDVTFSTDNNTLFDILRNMTGTTPGNASNSRSIIFLDVPAAKDQTNSKSGIKTSTGVWYDPWGSPYNAAIDGTYDNQIANPYGAAGGAGTDPLRQGVIAWSLGSDVKLGNNGDNLYKNASGVQSDDVISWQ